MLSMQVPTGVLDDHYLHDEHEYAAAARCVVDDPATFGV